MTVASDLLTAVRRLACSEYLTNAEADHLCRSVGVASNKYATLPPTRTVSVVDVAIHLASKGV